MLTKSAIITIFLVNNGVKKKIKYCKYKLNKDHLRLILSAIRNFAKYVCVSFAYSFLCKCAKLKKFV